MSQHNEENDSSTRTTLTVLFGVVAFVSTGLMLFLLTQIETARNEAASSKAASAEWKTGYHDLYSRIFDRDKNAKAKEQRALDQPDKLALSKIDDELNAITLPEVFKPSPDSSRQFGSLIQVAHELRDSLPKANTEILSLRNQVAALQRDREKFDGDLSEAQLKLTTAETQIAMLREEGRNAKETFEATRKQLESDLKAANGQTEAARAALRDTQTKLQATDERLVAMEKQAKAAAEFAAKELAGVQEQYRATAGQLEKTRADLDKAGNDLSKARADLESTAAKLAKEMQAGKELAEKLVASEAKVAKLSEDATKMSQELAEVTRKLDAAGVEAKKSADRLKEAEERISVFETENQKLKDEILKLKAEIEELKQPKDEKKSETTGAASAPAILPSDVIPVESLQKELERAQVLLALELDRFGPDHPRIRELRRRIDLIRASSSLGDVDSELLADRFGHEHPAVQALRRQQQLARQGRSEEEITLAELRRRFGEDHPRIRDLRAKVEKAASEL